MIRFRLKELIANKVFEENRRITMDEISEAQGDIEPLYQELPTRLATAPLKMY